MSKRSAHPGFIATLTLLVALAMLSSGCGFSEQAFPLQPGDVVAVEPQGSLESLRRDNRTWLAQTHAKLARLLDGDDPPALVTEEMSNGDGRPVDVFAHFDRNPDKLHRLIGNWTGLKQTAQGAGKNRDIEDVPPQWPGFEDVWIPVGDGVSVSGRLGLVRRAGKPVRADCIVIQPGFFGDNNIQRTQDMAAGLLACGFHVLTMEFRGHGRTEARYPQIAYTFGVFEVGDLLAISDWLTARPEVARTGLIGFSWGANTALLTAWYDGRNVGDQDIDSRLAVRLRPPCGRRHFEAGIVLFSPVLNFEHFMDRLDEQISYVEDPVHAKLQQMCRIRMEYKGYPDTDGSLRKLVRYECARAGLPPEKMEVYSLQFLQLLPGYDKAPGGKLSRVRTPTLIVQAANDPIGPAQEVADLLASVHNPNVAGIILPQGGHVGVQAYSRPYFYSLLVNFFDGALGPVAVDPTPSGDTFAHENRTISK